jgi:acetolactate synthase-1/2/3 large subunit
MVKSKRLLEYLIDYLVHNNIDTFFLVTGGAIAPTIDYIGTKKEAKYYCFQNEQPASMAAEAYYRVTGKMGVVLSTSGPGAQNVFNGVCGCWYESIPCLFLTGQVSTYESIDFIETKPRQLGFQETPIVEAFKPFTKYAKKITDPSTFKEDLQEALIASFEGRPGPILLDLPVDIQNSIIEYNKLSTLPSTKLIVDPELNNKIDELNNKIKESKRPLLVLGHGIRLSKSLNEIKELVDKLNIPFVVSWGGFDVISHDHPLYVGHIGVYGSRGGNFAIQNSDLLISIGSRLDTRQTGGNLKTFSRESFKVMVDIDRNEIYKGRGLNINLPIICDINTFLVNWVSTIDFSYINEEWSNKWNEWKHLEIENRPLLENTLTSYEFLEHLNTILPENSIIIPESGGNLVWTMQSLKTKPNQRIFSNLGNSSMGYGLSAAIGAAVETDNMVVCINGDGGISMNIQELQTVKQYNLPIKIIIMNNNCYGIIKQFQDAYFNSRYIATDNQDYTAPDFNKVAEAYGIKSIRIDKNNYKEEIKLALQEKDSIVINVIIDKEQKLTPKLEFGNPLEDMSPYLSDNDIKNNMIINMIPRRDNTKGWVTLKNH